jgi:predicted O-methyltransferase YrrM
LDEWITRFAFCSLFSGLIFDQIEVMLAPAAVSLQKLLDLHGEGSFDFVFIDADKV